MKDRNLYDLFFIVCMTLLTIAMSMTPTIPFGLVIVHAANSVALARTAGERRFPPRPKVALGAFLAMVLLALVLKMDAYLLIYYMAITLSLAYSAPLSDALLRYSERRATLLLFLVFVPFMAMIGYLFMTMTVTSLTYNHAVHLPYILGFALFNVGTAIFVRYWIIHKSGLAVSEEILQAKRHPYII